ncbi:Sulfotransferase [Chamberlinius hualienensis]
MASEEEKVIQTVKQMKEGLGTPRDGFEEFFKQCQPVPFPTASPDLCKFYKTPDGILVHDLTVQSYYDSRVMKSRASDIILASFPKAGTTWLQEITYLVAHDADTEKAQSAPTEHRMPFLEVPHKGINGIEQMADPRILKTHYPYELLPQSYQDNSDAKIIYIARNPKDTAVSYYNFYKMVGFVAYNGTLEELIHRAYDFDDIGGRNFFTHILGYWKRRDQNNMLFLLYEDLQKDLRSSVKKIADFIGKQLNDEQLTKIVEYCSFSNMSKNPMANYSHGGSAVKRPGSTASFMRKGKVGDWKNHLSEEISKKIDEAVERNLAGTGLIFEYEL